MKLKDFKVSGDHETQPHVSCVDETHEYHMWLNATTMTPETRRMFRSFANGEPMIYKNSRDSRARRPVVKLSLSRGMGKKIGEAMLAYLTPEVKMAYAEHCMETAAAAREETRVHDRRNRMIQNVESLHAALSKWAEFMRANYKREDCPDLWDPTVVVLTAIDQPT